ncbi:MAG: DUF1016 N-terminal domain-containing protein [Microthrixaceae bacterium]
MNGEVELNAAGDGSLYEQIAALVEGTRGYIATQANAALTMMYWRIGRLIDVEVLREGRAGYDQEIVGTLSPQLTRKYGRGFDPSNLHRMVKFSQVFPDSEIVGTLCPQLTWSHFRALLPLHSPQARQFYIEQAIAGRLSVRALRDLIGRQGFERKEIANAQTPGGSAVPADTFRDPYFFDALGLKYVYAERDLEAAIVSDLESFLLEVGNGVGLRRTSEANDDRQRRPLPRLVVLLQASPPTGCCRTQGRQVQSCLRGADEALPQVARPLRTARRRGSPDRPHPVYRNQSRTGRTSSRCTRTASS